MSDRLIYRIALIGGTGNLGPALALRWARAGYPVLIGSREAEKAERAAAEVNEKLGTEAVMGLDNADAVGQADVSVLTVNYTAHRAALESLREPLQGKLLIDTTARVDFRDPRPPALPAAAQSAQELLGPEVRVAAAFQSVPAHVLEKYWDRPIEQDVLVSTEEAADFELVAKLIEGLGLRPFYAGGLEHAITLEALAATIIAMNKHYRSLRGAIRVAGINP